MGDSTGSMFYAFLAFILIYVAGMGIYQLVLFVGKWRAGRRKGNGRDHG